MTIKKNSRCKHTGRVQAGLHFNTGCEWDKTDVSVDWLLDHLQSDFWRIIRDPVIARCSLRSSPAEDKCRDHTAFCSCSCTLYSMEKLFGSPLCHMINVGPNITVEWKTTVSFNDGIDGRWEASARSKIFHLSTQLRQSITISQLLGRQLPPDGTALVLRNISWFLLLLFPSIQKLGVFSPHSDTSLNYH